jgi:putative protease
MRQIEYICRRSPVEIEVFVHGALCFCHSGQCYMSALIGTHSANRGMCAQTCRMDYSLGGRMDEKPMSLKDNCLIRHVETLERIGVTSAKIEGRPSGRNTPPSFTEIYAKRIKYKKAPTPMDMEAPGAGLFPPGLHRRLLYGGEGTGNVRRPGEPDREVERLFCRDQEELFAGEVRRVPVKSTPW